MIFREAAIALEQIDSDDVAYRITTNPGTADLRRSIAILGLTSPPILYKKSDRYSIVSGFRRIAACRELGLHAGRMQVLAADADAFYRARVAIAENALQRPLNLIEQSRAYSLLAATLADPMCMHETCDAVGLPAHPDLIEKTLPLCRLPEPIQKGILTGRISLAMAGALRGHEMPTAVALVQLFDDLQLGLNRQREVLTLVEEIARRDDIRVSELLAQTEFRGILSDPNATAARKSQLLIERLKRRRYPRICRKTAEFAAAVEGLGLGGGLQLNPPKNFETGRYTLSMAFSSLRDFSQLHTRLGELLDDPAFKKLLE